MIADRLFEVAASEPARQLLYDPVHGRYTYGEIAEQVRRLAAGLRELGLGPDDRIILQLPNWVQFAVFHLAITALGGVTINLPLIFREKEVANVQSISGARVLVIPSQYRGTGDFISMAENLCRDVSGLHHVFTVGDGPGSDLPQVIEYTDFMTTAWENRTGIESPHETDIDDLTLLSFTSGTTGEQKGTMLSSRVLSAWNSGLAERYFLDEGECILGCSPFGHAVGLAHALRMTFTLGASLVLQEKWDALQAMQLIEQERCTFMAGATPFLMDVVYHTECTRHDLSSLRLFLCGGASIPEKLLIDARKALPDTFTSPLWGMTECGGVTTCPFDAPTEKLYTTDGFPCGSMELRVVNEDGGEVPRGTDGELTVRGPMVAAGYYNRPDLTSEHFLEDGFFRTGDQARMDDDGYIKITGRIKELIIRGGINISPVEIESVLFSHPRIANVAVIGIPDPRLGERICAFVKPENTGDTLKLEEIQSWMKKEGVAKNKWPERIETVDEFPITPSGKIQKFKLHALID